MLVPPTEGLKVAKYASGAGYAPDQWAKALAAVDWDRAELLSDKPGSSVWRAELVVQKRPMTLVIKCEPINSLKRKIQKLIHKTHAHRHWRGAGLLIKHGFRTAEVKAIVYGRRDGVEVECLIMEALEGRTVLAHLAAGDLSVREEHAVARACGRLVWELYRKAPNPDLKLSNLVVLDASPPRARLGMIDCVGVGRRADHMDMLAIQLIESIGSRVIPRGTICMRAVAAMVDHMLVEMRTAELKGGLEVDTSSEVRRQGVRQFWEEIELRAQSCGDPTPKHDPLGRAGSPPLRGR